MANKSLTMLQIRRIIQLKALGQSNRSIASELHSDRKTVNAYVHQIRKLDKELSDLLKLDDEQLSTLVHEEKEILCLDHRYTDFNDQLSVSLRPRASCPPDPMVPTCGQKRHDFT